MTTYIETWDETKPAGSRARSLGDDDIREFKRSVRERFATDHVAVADESGYVTVGHHKKLTLSEIQLIDPTNLANTGFVYMKDVLGKVELFWEDEDANVLQLTTGGSLNIVAADIDTLAVMLTGDQSVAGIKTFTSTPVVPAAAPTADAEVANKKYVDDQIDATMNVTTGHDHDGADSKLLGAASISSVLGAWAVKLDKTSYEATTDGFVSAYNENGDKLTVKTDAANPPTTIRAENEGDEHNESASILCPVRKGDYWKVNGADYVFWIPLGS